ncbi:MAG TPA: PepSY domain-containing protein [Ramlibacter sp.]|uniref:PepSY domain-containing protein n=1 Tax=Ramlibacter sp. TaxID=1917967 RepID=UPI002BBC972E|nr:PepSY domain-containing protein [Ramlibacter sp.]HVZ46213.1 PepSY domain-containing protein [Ramlibacter sp.]
MSRLRIAIAALFVACCALPAWADVSRDDAAALAQRQTGGRVLSVERADAGGRPVWRVKVVTPRGEVRVILVEVATGRPV